MSKLYIYIFFVAGPSQARVSKWNLFGIKHYAEKCLYNLTRFIDKDTNLLDAAFVLLLHHSPDTFIFKLVLGSLTLATEKQLRNKSITGKHKYAHIEPLHDPTPILSPDGLLSSGNDDHPQLNPTKIYCIIM